MTGHAFWRERRTFVTGATGIVGSWLVRELLAHGAHVAVLVKDADPQSELIRSGDIRRCTVFNGSVEDLWTLERAISLHEAEYVFHLAAQTIVGVAHRNPFTTFEANVRGTYNLLEACRIHAPLVRGVVIASSDKAYGEVDELNAVIGLARSIEMMPRIDEVLAPIQRDLFSLGALLATPHPEKVREQLEKARIDDARIASLERAIDDGEAELTPLTAFILPGGTPKSAALHVARTVCRRAERRAIALRRDVELPAIVVIYLNRLSDLLFVLARVANRRAGAAEVTW